MSPSGKTFKAHPHASLLESGLSAGISLPYRCNNGSCGDCRARVVRGEAKATQFHDYVLTGAEKSSGVILLCSHCALSDLEIEVSEALSAEDIPLQRLNSRICHAEISGDIFIVRLKLSRGKALWYLAGQYATLHLPDATTCRLPVASCPCETGYLEFHIPSMMARERSILEQLSRREKILVEGPQGNFTIDDAALPTHHHVLVAFEHHFAVVKPMIEHIIATEIDPVLTLLVVSPNPYKHNLCRSWDDAFDWFNYQSVKDVKSLQEAMPGLRSSAQPLKIFISAPLETQAELDHLLETADIHALTIRDNLQALRHPK